jgi:hypothetical protein
VMNGRGLAVHLFTRLFHDAAEDLSMH